jgi:pre-mRNA-processing factor 6
MSLATLKKRLRGAEAPPNYVAGLGRGAVGFTTRSDIGPARMPSDPYVHRMHSADLRYRTFGKNPPNYVAGRGRGMGGASTHGGNDDEEAGPVTTSLGDDEVGLFAGGVFDADDDEADAIYDAIDERMDGRRKDRRDKYLKEQQKLLRSERPKIQQQFAKLKEELSQVSADEWEAITDPGDISHKNKKQRYDRYTPAPTSLLEQARLESQINTTLDRRGGLTSATPGLITPGLVTPGFTTPGFMTPGVSSVQDLTKVGEAKQTIMKAKLVQASDSVTGQTSINPKGYLTDLSSVKLDTAAEVGDREHALKLFESVTSANPTHAPSWIALARLEEKAGKLARARKVIMQGCENCSKNEDIWLEAARLNSPEDAKSVLAQAVRFLPNSVKIWTKAAKLENDSTRKKRVLRKALEQIPNSPALWKIAVSLENPDDAKLMLYHAVECIPSSVEMWLALAKLETYDNAKRVLNDAPTPCSYGTLDLDHCCAVGRGERK